MIHEHSLKELLLEDNNPGPDLSGNSQAKSAQAIPGYEPDSLNLSMHFDSKELFSLKHPDTSIGEALKLLADIAKTLNNKQARTKDLAIPKVLLHFAADEIANQKKWYNLARDIFAAGKKAYTGVTGIAPEDYTIQDIPDANIATLWENFPVIDMFDLNPVYFSVLDDHVLQGLSNAYIEYLKQLPETAKLGSIQNIDVFAEKYVEDQHRTEINALSIQKPETMEL